MAVAERCTIVMIITSFRKHKTLVHFLRFSSANGEITRINAKNTAGDTCKVNQEMVAFDSQIYSRSKSTTALQIFSYALRDQSCVLTFSLLSPSLTLSGFPLNPLTVYFQFLFSVVWVRRHQHSPTPLFILLFQISPFLWLESLWLAVKKHRSVQLR
jgi:hypothetical protein